jgi:dolichol-phosphate mannosyltransferase
MSLSIIIPCYNEEKVIAKTIHYIQKSIKKVNYEIVIIDDFSTDNTLKIVNELINKYSNIRIIKNNKKGLGGAINAGISSSKNKFLCIFMSDMSDSISDLKNYYKLIKNKKVDAIFGSRFLSKSSVIDYPYFKLLLNRIFNLFIKILFLSNYNDFTNAFKIYNRKSLLKLRPFVSENFNIFLELSLKIISRKFKYIIIPIGWKNRKKGISKFRIGELGSKYFFTLLYCWLEKILILK